MKNVLDKPLTFGVLCGIVTGMLFSTGLELATGDEAPEITDQDKR